MGGDDVLAGVLQGAHAGGEPRLAPTPEGSGWRVGACQAPPRTTKEREGRREEQVCGKTLQRIDRHLVIVCKGFRCSVCALLSRLQWTVERGSGTRSWAGMAPARRGHTACLARQSGMLDVVVHGGQAEREGQGAPTMLITIGHDGDDPDV